VLLLATAGAFGGLYFSAKKANDNLTSHLGKATSQLSDKERR
jgi:hypothetical protein